MKTFILCAGKQKRFGGNTPKQLLRFNGTPLLKRTINQLKTKPYIVTTNTDIIDFCRDKNALVLYPENSDKCVNTLLSTTSLWDERIIVLLGDVYYNAKCLELTYNCNQDLCVIGNGVEIFSLSFEPSTKIISALKTASKHELGKLWHFYRVYAEIDIDSHARDTQGLYFIPSDNTNDIDTYQEYLQLKGEVETAAKHI